MLTVFSVEDRGPANWAKPEYELGALISDANEFARGTEYSERRRETGQCGKDTAGPALAGETVTQANAAWFAVDLNA